MYEEKFSLSFYLKLLGHKLKIIYHTWSISLGTFCMVRQFYDFHVKIPSFIFTMTNWFSRWRVKQSACTVEVFLKKLFKTFTSRCWFVERNVFAVLTSFWNFEAEIGDRNFVYFLDVVSIFCQNFVNRKVLDLRNLIGGLEHKTRKAESVSVPHLKINWIC